MKREYQELMESIPVPEGLEERVLSAARRQGAERHRGTLRPVLRTAVCAACALAVVLGSWSLRPAEDGEEGLPGVVPSYSFGLTARAADTGETWTAGANSGLAMQMDMVASWSPKDGYYTGCLFQVTGEGVRTVGLSLDKGGLYRLWQEEMTEEETAAIQAAQEAAGIGPVTSRPEEDGAWSVRHTAFLGGSVETDYDPEIWYGLWTEGADAARWREDSRAAARESLDQLDGAVLTVSVTYENGETQRETYRLSTDKLRVDWNEDGAMSVLQEVAAASEGFFVYGVVAVPESESRWFSWPVAGSNAVRLSNPYGQRTVVIEDPEEGEEPELVQVHHGIDIPGETGTAVTAAMDGTVTEAGYTAELGYYLVLDHGGGLETVYAHCLRVDVKQGDAVRAGDAVAALGSTGMTTGPHLCFQVRQDGAYQNPVAYFESALRRSLTGV